MGKRATQDIFSKSLFVIFRCQKYIKRVHRNDKKILPWDFEKVSWVALFPTTKLPSKSPALLGLINLAKSLLCFWNVLLRNLSLHTSFKLWTKYDHKTIRGESHIEFRTHCVIITQRTWRPTWFNMQIPNLCHRWHIFKTLSNT